MIKDSRVRRSFIIIVLLLALTGCAVTPPKQTLLKAKASPAGSQSQWDAHQQQVSRLSTWQAKGRLALARGNKGQNASFLWEQHGEFYQIKLWGPFGAGAIYIIGGPHQVQAKTSDGKILRAATPEALMQQAAGWQLPISGLRYWLTGLPSPTTKIQNYVLTPQGQLSRLSQNGWRIQYEDYQPYKNTLLAHKLLLKNGDLSVKLIITSWE